MAEMSEYSRVCERIRSEKPRTWVITGAAGFIGSHLVERLLLLSQKVVGLDNFITGNPANLHNMRAHPNFQFIEGDIRQPDVCAYTVKEADIVLHHAALTSVERARETPQLMHEINVDGFFVLLSAAHEAKVKRFIYAGSSSSYGDSKAPANRESEKGTPLSFYAATKTINEIYAAAFAAHQPMQTLGLRYTNIFGPRENARDPYAAVVAQWMNALLRKEACYINGDGETSRDFCYVANVVEANILAALSQKEISGEVVNISGGENTTLNRLFTVVCDSLAQYVPDIAQRQACFREFRTNDIRHSHADITKAGQLLGYHPSHTLVKGLEETAAWYAENFKNMKYS